MLSHYSPRGFFRQVSNNLLQDYFESKGALVDVDWAGLDETEIQPVFEAWLELPEAIQQAADADFTEVDRLATDAGIAILIQEGEWHGLRLNEVFEGFDDQTDMVMWTFLRHPDVVRVAALFQTADTLASRSWHRWKQLPYTEPNDDPATRKALEAAFADYFLRREGRGRHCTVEVYRRAEDYYYFVFLEDYARAEQDYVDGRLVRQTHRRAFQVVIVCSPDLGAMDISGPGGRRVLTQLVDLAVPILYATERPNTPRDERVYHLEGLRDEGTAWSYPSTAGIASVWVKALRLTFKGDGDRLLLEGGAKGAVHRRYAHLTGGSAGPGHVVPESTYVTQAVIRVEYAERDGARVSPRDIRLTWPNHCNLGQDQRDRVLREMLVTSGIDPHKIGRDAER